MLQSTGDPSGFLYHYFATKHDFTFGGQWDAYHHYFCRKLTRYLEDESLPLARLVASSTVPAGHDPVLAQRGCLCGQLGQEVVQLSPSCACASSRSLLDWEALPTRCLRDAVTAGSCP